MNTNEQLVARFQSGDNTAAAALYEQNLPLLKKLSRRFVVRYQDYDDALQEAAVALLQALRGYDPERGVKFITYLWPAVCRQLQQWRLEQRFIYMPQTAWERGVKPARRINQITCENRTDNPVDLAADVRTPEAEYVEEFKQKLFASAAVETVLRKMLTPRQATVLRGRLGGKGLREVGDELGICKERVRQIQDQALEEIGLGKGALGRPKSRAS